MNENHPNDPFRNEGPGQGRQNDPGRHDKQGSGLPGGPKSPISMFVIFSILALIATHYMYNSFGGSGADPKELSYSKFIELIKSDQVESVKIEAKKIDITLKADTTFEGNEDSNSPGTGGTAGVREKQLEYYTNYIVDDSLLGTLEEHRVEINVAKEDNTAAIIYNLISFILPVVLLIGFYAYMMRRSGGGPFSVGRSTAKVYVEKSTGVNFSDVAGQDEAKESLQEVVDFLHNPQKYTAIGAKLPKGALLVGPPGTGKTLLAKAVAGEAGVPFFSLAGSDFVEMFVGVGASRVRDLFKDAQKAAPCIIFIDEIDAIGKSRDSRYGGGNDEREQTLNQLLAEMDGFDTSKGLLILAATNRPEVLDKALLRPGRFDRRIIVDRPDLRGRLETLKVHSKDVAMDETVDLDAMALASAGLVGSDLANIINEAAIIAVKSGRKYVNQADLFEAFELVAVGGKEKKDRVMSDKERRVVSYHEVGHALVSAFQKNTEPVQKITIVPRTMGALGYTLQTPEEEKYLETKEELLAKICTFMAGRAAEELVFESATSGAANDIEKATSIARNMVTRFGMSDRFGMMGLATVESQYLEGRAALTCGESTASEIDTEVLAIINDSYQKAFDILSENRDVLDKIADYLYKHETITGKEFMDMFRELTGIEPEDQEEAIPMEDMFEDEESEEHNVGRHVDLVAEG
ncbi:MAG: ATP-dependent zinc metalloprotease FtsH [Lachnospiraceae bacterium]|nr:ATP-dependent zinc metalloprotease FtsH [Lachnospiraceae bacterium]